MSKHSWIDDDWSRDWLFWVPAILALIGIAMSVMLTDTSVWAVGAAGLGFFALTVGALGFVRTVRRSYRGD